jgi:hypothetical protein
MKRFFTILALIALGILQAHSQDDLKNEVSVSVGTVTAPQIANLIGSVIGGSLTGQKVKNSRGTGAITVSYNRHASPKFSYGVSGTWEKLTSEFENSSDKLSWSSLAFMGGGRYHYVSKKALTVYSGLSAGYSFINMSGSGDREKKGAFAFQVDAIGLRLGSRIGVFGEAGFGYEGLIKAGLSMKY